MAIQKLIKSCLPLSPASQSARFGAISLSLAVLLVSNAASADASNRSIKIDRPVIGLNPDQVCSGISYYDFEGNAQDGTLRCGYDACNEDGSIGCLATQDFPAANIANISNGDLKKDKSIAGIAGSLKSCNTDKEVNCIANATFTAAEMTRIKEGDIKKGEIIASVTGKYPSEQFPLPGKGTSNRVLNSGNFVASLTQTAETTEFWDHKGVRHAGSTTAKIIPENIKHGVEIFGVTGDIQPYTGFNPADLRIGVEIGGVPGTLKTDCRNSSNESASDPDKTIDDSALPALKPFGEDHHCAEDVWVGKYDGTGNPGTCTNLQKKCVWQNTITKTYWGGNQQDLTNQSFQNAKNHCSLLTAAGYSSGWRLPTQKELMSAYAQGAVWMAGNDSNLRGPHDLYWSSTAVSHNVNKRYVVDMRTGEVSSELSNISSNMGVICVHDFE